MVMLKMRVMFSMQTGGDGEEYTNQMIPRRNVVVQETIVV